MVTKQIVFLLALIIVNNALSMNNSDIHYCSYCCRDVPRLNGWNARDIVEWDRSEAYWDSRDLSDKEQEAKQESGDHKDNPNATEPVPLSTSILTLDDIVIAKALFGDTHKPTQ